VVLFFATGNEGKFREVSALAAKLGVEIQHSRTPYLEIQADELSDIAKVGVQQVFGILKAPCFVEDSGLFIHSLRGFPGPYSKYVFLTIGNRGVLKLLEGVGDRRAVFRSAVGYCGRDGRPLVFEGRVEGRISLEERGTGGFGFDPIFIPDEGDGRTFAEMSVEEKNALSHRGRAIEGFFRWYLLHREE
jgi:XTP/dITP diphosphohydrolase